MGPPHWLPPLFLPSTFVALLVASSFHLPGPEGDTPGDRLEYSVQYLARLTAGDLLGFYDKGGVVAADSGWAYFILARSIFGMAAVWLMLTVRPAGASVGERRFIGGAALFMAASLPISVFSLKTAVFSVKTAALLWATYGCLIGAAARSKMAFDRRQMSRTTQLGPIWG